jgi:hypothetical protein
MTILFLFQSAIYDDFIVKMRNDLQSKGVISRVEYAGSRFKGTPTATSDYDNMFVKRDTSIAVQRSTFPGYDYLTKAGLKVSRDESLRTFKGHVQQSLRSIGAAGYVQIGQAYGPTIVVYYRKPGGPEFQIDMVFALEVSEVVGKDLYVAKAPRESAGVDNLWYKTVVLDEKYNMRGIDKGNAVGKWAVRRLKSLKEIEPGLQPITSYSFEQVLMYLKDEKPDPMFWRENNMKEILVAMLLYMVKALERGELLSYYDASNNAIARLTPVQRDQLANRFNRLAKNPQDIIDRTN